jgi:hypothetical protein
MPLRIVGAASIILGVCIVALGFSQMAIAKELAAEMMSDGPVWNLPVTQEVFLARSEIWRDVVIIAGALTAAGGLGMALRKHWGLYATVAAALVMLVFPLISRLFSSKDYAFGLSLVELAIAAVIGLSASLAWMFRPK